MFDGLLCVLLARLGLFVRSRCLCLFRLLGILCGYLFFVFGWLGRSGCSLVGGGLRL